MVCFELHNKKANHKDPQKLIRLIQAATGQRVIPGETLLILDELQECPSALTSLKFFNEDMPELAVMAAGALLGLAWGKSNGDKPQAGDSDAVYSFPVGKVNRLNVYPMTPYNWYLRSGSCDRFAARPSVSANLTPSYPPADRPSAKRMPIRGAQAHLGDGRVVNPHPPAIAHSQP